MKTSFAPSDLSRVKVGTGGPPVRCKLELFSERTDGRAARPYLQARIDGVLPIFSILLALGVTLLSPALRAAASDISRAAYLDRVNEVIAWTAHRPSPPADPPAAVFAHIAAKLALHEDAPYCSRELIALLRQPYGDMFWMFPVTAVACLDRGQLSPEAEAALREAWHTYMPYRGDTENHFLMYYASLYLMAQHYPGESGDRWFNGKSSAENEAEARAYLLSWIDLTTTRGQGEYNSPRYLAEYAIPLLCLASWAEDPVLRQRGRMMLDYIMADFAVNTLDGMYLGAHSRVDDLQVLEKWNGLSSFFAWLFFDNCRPPTGYGEFGSHFALAAASYELPEVIARIATDRSQPYLERDLKRTRHRWRNGDVRDFPVYKTTYMTQDYAVGSDQGGILSPIQEHSWDVSWAVPDPRAEHNTMYSMHPYSSPFELQMYFTDPPDFIVESVTRSKKSYDSPDKLLGGSPYEQVFQDLDTIVALYDIPPGTRFPHINGFFSGNLARREEDPSGWIFAQGGATYLAYRPLAPYAWRPLPGGDWRLESPHLKNGTVLQAAGAREFSDFAAFRRAILALPFSARMEPVPTVTMRSLRGHEIVCAYGAAPQVDGHAIDYARDWKLFDGPYLHSEPGSRRLVITHDRLTRVLDFNTGTITDSVAQP